MCAYKSLEIKEKSNNMMNKKIRVKYFAIIIYTHVTRVSLMNYLKIEFSYHYDYNIKCYYTMTLYSCYECIYSTFFILLKSRF